MLKAENETISVTAEPNLISLKEKDLKLYEEMKETYGDDVVILIDQENIQNGKKLMYVLENFGIIGTITDRQKKLDNVSENLKEKTGSGYEKTIINNHIAYKSIHTENDTRIIEYIILGDENTFSINQISSIDLSAEAYFQQILSTVKINKN